MLKSLAFYMHVSSLWKIPPQPITYIQSIFAFACWIIRLLTCCSRLRMVVHSAFTAALIHSNDNAGGNCSWFSNNFLQLPSHSETGCGLACYFFLCSVHSKFARFLLCSVWLVDDLFFTSLITLVCGYATQQEAAYKAACE